MSNLFEENEEEVLEGASDFEDIELDAELDEPPGEGLDARRRLEHMLEEKRLRDDLDDFVDY